VLERRPRLDPERLGGFRMIGLEEADHIVLVLVALCPPLFRQSIDRLDCYRQRLGDDEAVCPVMVVIFPFLLLRRSRLGFYPPSARAPNGAKNAPKTAKWSG
jgi:hypothetical protein